MTNFVIVPVRNGLHLTRNAVKDFLAQDIGDVEVLVIDNASTDGTTQWLHTQDVRTMHFNPPRSVAASWNAGLRWVFGPHPQRRVDVSNSEHLRVHALFDNSPEYALVVNNDVRLRPDTYRWLVEDGSGFVTAVGTTDAEKIKPVEELKAGEFGYQILTRKGELLWYSIHHPEAPKRRHPDFSCYLIRREVFEKVGSFDEEFHGAYAEDSDFHLRMHQAGIEAICLDLPFLHYGAQTIKQASKEEADGISIQADRNRAYFKQKHGVEVGSPEYYALFGHDSPD